MSKLISVMFENWFWNFLSVWIFSVKAKKEMALEEPVRELIYLKDVLLISRAQEVFYPQFFKNYFPVKKQTGKCTFGPQNPFLN